jgi:hypothetical protein
MRVPLLGTRFYAGDAMNEMTATTPWNPGSMPEETERLATKLGHVYSVETGPGHRDALGLDLKSNWEWRLQRCPDCILITAIGPDGRAFRRASVLKPEEIESRLIHLLDSDGRPDEQAAETPVGLKSSPCVYRLEDLVKALLDLLHADPATRSLPVCVLEDEHASSAGEHRCLDKFQGLVTTAGGTTVVGITLG